MLRKKPVCIVCSSAADSHVIERHGRQLIMEEFMFNCGARQKESFTTNGNVGKVEFFGGNCTE